MRLFFAVILGIVLFSVRGMAQEDDYIGTATSALQGVLSTLKQSVEKLNIDNQHWEARDNAMKQQVSQLQAQLGQLEDQGNFLDKAAAQLQDKNPRRAAQIARLEKQNADLDNRAQEVQTGINAVRQSLDEGGEENQKLTSHLQGITNAPPQAPSPGTQAAERRQKEKLKLMKMIYESQQRQGSLHQAILKIQKKPSLSPAGGAPAAQPDQRDEADLRQLEAEFRDLEKNYAQFKNLVEQMGKKAKAGRMTVSQHIEEEKLQGSMDDLNRQGAGLRKDLDDLRSQMVDLDKRKSRLETMVQQLP